MNDPESSVNWKL